SFESLQLDVVEAYREASRAAGYGEGHVMVSRQMIPVTGDAELERYVSLIPRERAAAPGVSGEHRSLEIGGREAVYSQIVLDVPSVVAQPLIADLVGGLHHGIGDQRGPHRSAAGAGELRAGRGPP